MADKKPWLGPETFPTIWIWICLVFNLIGIAALIMLIIAEFVILVNDYSNYHAQYGYSYSARGYEGSTGCGQVEYTNAPKHLGSAIWMLFYQLSIIVLATLVIASDLAWRASSYNAWGGRWISTFYATGITEGSMHPGLFYYVAANAFLKLFLVVLYMNQSFYGMRGHSSHASPYSNNDDNNHYYTGNSSSSASSSSSSSSSSSVSQYSWKRGNGSSVKIYGVEAWVYFAGWIAVCSIIPSMIAFLYLAAWGKKKVEEGEGGAEVGGKG
ncbi:hypothetical protein C366_01965 [Cryptococcus neoformans Tu401-1]|nr:hypothetical protein C366_01965 [Cryptococcus neoformans var. grubii Tu401-1]